MTQYEPHPGPVISDADMQKIVSYVYRELKSVSTAFDGVQAIQLQMLHVAPPRLITGMIVLADGTDWNPGHGRGFYGYDGSIWNFFGAVPPASAGSMIWG